MPEKTLWVLREEIYARLRELGKKNFPQYRSYQKLDGTWVECEETPEYLEQEALIYRAKEPDALERYFSMQRNPLLISMKLGLIAQPLSETAIRLQTRIAQSVYTNAPVI